MRKNDYTCRKCGKSIITQEVDEGTTPMLLKCRATEGCNGDMISGMYQVDQDSPATFEWYKPKRAKNPAEREYLDMGGLLIRPVSQKG